MNKYCIGLGCLFTNFSWGHWSSECLWPIFLPGSLGTHTAHPVPSSALCLSYFRILVWFLENVWFLTLLNVSLDAKECQKWWLNLNVITPTVHHITPSSCDCPGPPLEPSSNPQQSVERRERVVLDYVSHAQIMNVTMLSLPAAWNRKVNVLSVRCMEVVKEKEGGGGRGQKVHGSSCSTDRAQHRQLWWHCSAQKEGKGEGEWNRGEDGTRNE